MKVHELLSTRDRWTQGALARRSSTLQTATHDPEAVCWCLAGAIVRCYHKPEEYWPIIKKVTEELAIPAIAAWNDRQGRTWKEVIELAQRLDI